MQRDYNGYAIAPFMLKLIFSPKSSKKSEKEGGSNFVLLSSSRNLNWWFIKNLFPQTNQDYAIFVHVGKFKNVYHNFNF